jgi:hypothetical protein
MPAPQLMLEFRQQWLPNAPRSAVLRLAELLRAGSPLLIHGRFVQTPPQGCLATQIAWHHPATQHLDIEAGITWLTRVAGLNPATSRVVTAWDRDGVANFELRDQLLNACKEALEVEPCSETELACMA